MKRFFAVLVLSLLSLSFIVAQETRPDFFVQAGIGLSAPNYPSETEDTMKLLASAPGISHVRMSFDGEVGYATIDNLFIVARIDGVGDRLYDKYNNCHQLDMYLFSTGARYLSQGSYAEANIGVSGATLSTSYGVADTSNPAIGWELAIGYDFTPPSANLGVGVEARYDGFVVDSYNTGAFLFTVNLMIK
jgi:hypothetical protein